MKSKLPESLPRSFGDLPPSDPDIDLGVLEPLDDLDEARDNGDPVRDLGDPEPDLEPEGDLDLDGDCEPLDLGDPE